MHRLYAVSVVTLPGLRETPLFALRTRAQVDLLLARGLTLRVQIAERV